MFHLLSAPNLCRRSSKQHRPWGLPLTSYPLHLLLRPGHSCRKRWAAVSTFWQCCLTDPGWCTSLVGRSGIRSTLAEKCLHSLLECLTGVCILIAQSLDSVAARHMNLSHFRSSIYTLLVRVDMSARWLCGKSACRDDGSCARLRLCVHLCWSNAMCNISAAFHAWVLSTISALQWTPACA